jgi:hypothetical protein
MHVEYTSSLPVGSPASNTSVTTYTILSTFIGRVPKILRNVRLRSTSRTHLSAAKITFPTPGSTGNVLKIAIILQK